METNKEIIIPKEKTRFGLKLSSLPQDGTVDYICPTFFNKEGVQHISYTDGNVIDDDIYAEENHGAAREGEFWITAHTNPSQSYEAQAEAICGWTISQAGAGPTPTPVFEFSAVVDRIPATRTLIEYDLKTSEEARVMYDDKTVVHPASSERYISGFTVPVNHSAEEVDYIMTARTSDSVKTAKVTQEAAWEAKPLTFEILSSGVFSWKTTDGAFIRNIEYSMDGEQWVPMISSTGGTEIQVEDGDFVQFRGDNSEYGDSTNIYTTFSGTTCRFNVKGNIMSLIDSHSFETLDEFGEGAEDVFCGLFKDCTALTDASELILPATTLVSYCYSNMFAGCTNLVVAPELPATTLANSCYSGMFSGDTSLTTPPSILPAAEAPGWSCKSMFAGCTSLTTAPQLPATSVMGSCYSYMFDGCISLLAAPDLPATALPQWAYQYMFQNCRNLRYIKCLARFKATDATTSWVSGVQTNKGTFVKASNATWITGPSGIPNGWTVEVPD